jgi:hypothetical protein
MSDVLPVSDVLPMSEDLRAILDECKEGNLAIINGEIFESDESEVPLAFMLDRGMYNQLVAIAVNDGFSISEFITHKLNDIIVNNTFECADDIEKVAEEFDGSMGDVDVEVDDPNVPPDTDDDDDEEDSSDTGFIGWGYGSLSEEKNSSVLNQEKYSAFSSTRVFDKFKQVVAGIHGKREGPISIGLRFDNPGEILLNLKYEEDGYSFECTEDGGLDAALTGVAQRLAKWHKVAFSPKLDPDTPVMASVGAKILEFDKATGEYMLELGDGLVVRASPEDVDVK